MNKIKQEKINGEIFQIHGLKSPVLSRCSVLPNLIYRFNTIPIKIRASYFTDIDKLVLRFTWRGKRPRTANTILKEKN